MSDSKIVCQGLVDDGRNGLPGLLRICQQSSQMPRDSVHLSWVGSSRLPLRRMRAPVAPNRERPIENECYTRDFGCNQPGEIRFPDHLENRVDLATQCRAPRRSVDSIPLSDTPRRPFELFSHVVKFEWTAICIGLQAEFSRPFRTLSSVTRTTGPPAHKGWKGRINIP